MLLDVLLWRSLLCNIFQRTVGPRVSSIIASESLVEVLSFIRNASSLRISRILLVVRFSSDEVDQYSVSGRTVKRKEDRRICPSRPRSGLWNNCGAHW